MCRHRRYRYGFTIRELTIVLGIATCVVGIVVPTLAYTNDNSRITTSMSNLMAISVGEFMYAADWNGRQYTVAVDELGYFGDDAIEALHEYGETVGTHPQIWLGWNEQGLWYFPFWDPYINTNWTLVLPVSFNNDSFGNMRLLNVKAPHDYVSGRFYDPVYYAPNDHVVYKTVEPLFDNPSEYIPSGETGGDFWSSYCYSAAARYDPDVFRAPSQGGWQDPFELGYGLQTPGYFEVLHPDLKTQVMEHNWNQSPPGRCNPLLSEGTYHGCEPYYFNHGIDSTPVTLFYDGHVRILRNREAFEADQMVLKQSGGVDGLWSRDTPMGAAGYYGDESYDGTQLSHHVLTTDGIRGRDTLPEF